MLSMFEELLLNSTVMCGSYIYIKKMKIIIEFENYVVQQLVILWLQSQK